MPRWMRAGVLALAAALAAPAQGGGPEGLGAVRFNEHQIEDRARPVDLSDPMAVFAELFSRLDDEVTVYPTENYYYFSFDANGRTWSGNFRLHPVERDEGLINFAYFDTGAPSDFHHLLLGAADGVTVTREEPLLYRVEHGGRAVRFRLNPLSQARPGPPLVGPGEAFVGRGFDESGLTLVLVFDQRARSFLWVLDPDQVMPVALDPAGSGIGLHAPSGFAFLREPGSGRDVLIGVDGHEVARNTYNDGPFDQLPDNWLANTRFREFAELTDPAMPGTINERGEFRAMPARMAIMPYMIYRDVGEVGARVAGCGALAGAARTRCLFAPGG